MSLDAGDGEQTATCAFCAPDALDLVLHETENFLVIADHAPMIEGHLLIVPREHYACYGALPAELWDEFLALKRTVRAFMEAMYRPPVFFEHGVFRQTVFHAHLHAFPFGPIPLDVHRLAEPDGCVVRSLEDVRAWYRERGHYFFLEQPPHGGRPATAAVFPPVEARYFAVLGMLRESASAHGGWDPPAVRRMLGMPKMRALAAKWREYATHHALNG
jgi:diadenosine tetraphosphate (Ap4A) HIT family hydrolase